jgi:hypothetical protein
LVICQSTWIVASCQPYILRIGLTYKQIVVNYAREGYNVWGKLVEALVELRFRFRLA